MADDDDDDDADVDAVLVSNSGTQSCICSKCILREDSITSHCEARARRLRFEP
jgi:hypothetical protein